MTCTHCHRAECATSVELIDGRSVCSWSDDWRDECEARHVLAIPTLKGRQEYLLGKFEHVEIRGKWTSKCTSQGIKQRRGDDALNRLKTTMTELWKKRK